MAEGDAFSKPVAAVGLRCLRACDSFGGTALALAATISEDVVEQGSARPQWSPFSLTRVV